MDSTNNSPNQQPEGAEPSRTFGLFLRLFWMFLGNMVLFICAMKIVENRTTLFSPADVVYVISLFLLIGSRYVDIAHYQGATATGEPATMGHWRRYTAGLILCSVGAWIACHAIAYWLSQ